MAGNEAIEKLMEEKKRELSEQKRTLESAKRKHSAYKQANLWDVAAGDIPDITPEMQKLQETIKNGESILEVLDKLKHALSQDGSSITEPEIDAQIGKVRKILNDNLHNLPLAQQELEAFVSESSCEAAKKVPNAKKNDPVSFFTWLLGVLQAMFKDLFKDTSSTFKAAKAEAKNLGESGESNDEQSGPPTLG
jgi:hypothetical protein